MPRVHTKTKSTRGRTYTCEKCGQPILPGHSYHTWSFRYGGARFQHSACGYPLRSQLTQSKMSTVYSAMEGVQDGLAKLTSLEDIETEVQTLAETVREIEEEYREAAEPFGDMG